ncbi:MAG: hypothetical protein ACOC8N_04820 [Spirochaetota bacterium]
MEYLKENPPSEWAKPTLPYVRPGVILRPGELEQITDRPVNKREGGRSGGGSPDPGHGFDWNGMKELGSNIMNSVLDNVYDDYQQGAEWGATEGQIIGAASGMQDAVNTVAKGATAMDLVEAAGGAAVDQVIPDPYEIVGYYAGGGAITLF